MLLRQLFCFHYTDREKGIGAELQDIRTIGIPRGLLFYQYGVLWQRFLEELGYQVEVSAPPDRAIFDAGEAASVDEVCLASKTYMGHVAALLDGGRCDAIFVPSYDSADVRAGFCTKYQSLPDLVAATFADRMPQLITMRVSKANDRKQAKADFLELGRRLGAAPRRVAHAYKVAQRAQDAADAAAAAAQQETLHLLDKYRKVAASDPTGAEQPPLAILLVAHRAAGRHRHLRRPDRPRCRLQAQLRLLRHAAVAHQPAVGGRHHHAASAGGRHRAALGVPVRP